MAENLKKNYFNRCLILKKAEQKMYNTAIFQKKNTKIATYTAILKKKVFYKNVVIAAILVFFKKKFTKIVVLTAISFIKKKKKIWTKSMIGQ